jgi:menaquinone-specific isochorismate synthase
MLSRERTGAARTRGSLADQASRVLSEAASPEERVVRLSVPIGAIDPLRWLDGQRLFPRLYWAGRGDGREVAAAGIADLREAAAPDTLAELRKDLASLLIGAGARYYGGMRFDPAREPDAEWAAFGAYRFVLPRFELHTGGAEGATLVCNLVFPRDAQRRAEVLEQIEALPAWPEAGGALPQPLSRTDGPDEPLWRRNVERALSSFAEGRASKVVLARRTEVVLGGEVGAAMLVGSLKKATPGCFHFCIEPEEGVAFVGASPERLFRREGRAIESEAVAGTRPRGASEADDAELREELLRSEKDKAEHDYVRRGIAEALGPLCCELEVERGVSEMKLASRRHLVSKVRGTLREDVTDAEVLRALHPTPAVCGYPKEEALAEIRALEPFDRGWYAGPVGWIGADGAEFAVGIRSGLARGSRLALFSGAGIVEGSVPEAEWAEIEQKIGDFTGMFGFDPRGHFVR